MILKENKRRLLISSLLILLPIVLGLLRWNDLPEQVVTHWNFSGEPDGWSSKAFAVFFLPLFLLAVHWLCVLVTARDSKNKGQNRKALALVLWIVPVVSLFTNAMIYAAAFGIDPDVEVLSLFLIGLMFVVIGNYLPKCKQNHTIGIKVKWTLESEENWNATHRMAGKLWVVGGLLMMGCVFLPKEVIPYAFLLLFPVIAMIPIIYSYVLSRKQCGK